jgi:mono/diheme cytochrome c family protein
VRNPLPALNADDLKEAERLYLINCGICHGAKLDGNGPLYNGSDGPYPAKPATLVGDAKYEAMPEGQMYYSTTYGKNLMGSYASQLQPKQRWMVIAYIKSKQAKPAAAAAPAAVADSTAKK